MKCCKDCAHYTDAHYSRVYVTPACTQRGQDSAAYMRQHVCGVEEARLYQPRDDQPGNMGSQQWKNKPNENQPGPQR